MVVEILETTANDLDVFVGIGSTPHKLLERASSTEPGPMEYLNIFQPSFPTQTGACWILVQNWESSEPGAVDPIKLAYGFVAKTPSTNYTITGPASVPALNPFDLTVDWNLGSSFAVDKVWYGWFSIGTSATKKDDVGKLDFNLYNIAEYQYLPVINRP